MNTTWELVKNLEGHTLSTVTGRGQFEIIKVSDRKCQIRIQSSQKERHVHRTDLDKAAELGPATSLTTALIRSSGASEYSPTYVLAILLAAERNEAN